MCEILCVLKRALLTILLLISCSCCRAFNVDTDFPIIYKGSKGSYFGYTTALHKNRWGYMALVGAPKANTTTFRDRVHEPGTLYSCSINSNPSTGQCREVLLMTEGAVEENRKWDNAYRDKKDSMWLGVSLDVRPNSRENSENDIITCGHLWKNEFHRQLHLVNGVCYVINGNLDPDSVKKLLPLTQRTLQYGRDQDGSTEYSHALGQAGMSVAFSEDGSRLILGAPGIWTWKGSLVIYSWHDNRNNIYKNPLVPHPPQEVKFSSYFGYSVTTGKFFEPNAEYIAAGAPRDRYNGRVYIVRQIGNNIRIRQKKQGAQMGEYFGASVLGVNLNGDSFSDLLVGAPQYSQDSGGDEGKVYVYISNGKDLQKYTELTGDRKENARFGTALAHIGDINQDGFSDIAVGAPYENTNGAIYIYHGSRSGVKTNYAQKIEASSLNSRLSGFGIHISRGMDIDENGYPDILIGSYASSNAVLLRSRPIIHVFPELTFNPRRININQTTCDVSGITLTCVGVDACLWYTGKHVPSSLEFRFTVSIQDSIRRGFFTEKRSRKSGLKMVLDSDTKLCSQFQFYLNEDVKDVITPISIQFANELVKPAGFKTNFNETFPLYHPSSLTNITSELPFHTGCGKDDECHADLVVLAGPVEPGGEKITILGTFSTITVQIIVKNVKEPAYLSELLIDLPPELPSIKYDYFCDVGNQQNNASLVCSLGNPLRNGTQVDINIKLDATKIPPHTKYLEIVCRAVTLSTEENPEDNIAVVPLHLETIADIGIIGVPSDNQIMYNGKKGNSSIISHTYTARNHGPSPLEYVNIFLNIPYTFLTSNGKKQFVSIRALEKDIGTRLSIPVTCDDDFLNLEEVQLNLKPRAKSDTDFFLEDKQNSTSLYASKYSPEEAPMDFIRRSDVQPKDLTGRDDTGNNSTASKMRGYVAINCNRDDIECISLRCSAAGFTSPRKFAQISVRFQVNYTVLDDYLGSWYQIEFVTTGYILVSDPTVIQIHDHPDSFDVKTMIFHEGPPPPEEIAPWILFVSVGVGVLLLVIILIILIKIGFFRRKEKDMMKEMLVDTNKGEENPQEVNDSDALPQ